MTKITLFLVLSVAVSAIGCTADTDADAPEELADPSDDVADTDGDEVVSSHAEALTLSSFQLPFPCGQYWSGQTRTNHVPLRGVDFNRTNDYGDTVVAANSGTVRVVANYGDRGYGRWIEINHGNGWATRYAHLSYQAVRVGQYVRRGQRIGNVGNTGGSSGSHLHYEQLYNGTAVRAMFNGAYAYYYGTRTYRSRNC